MNVVPPARTCSDCGAELAASALEGLCPKCLAAFAFGPQADPSQTGHPPANKIGGFDGYELLEEIARGGMGVVFKARQTRLNRIVAVKTILAGQLATEAEVQRFRAEAEAAAHLQHPNIVAIHEVGERDGLPYFSMDYVEGRNLGEVARAEPLEAKRAAGYLKQIAEAVAYAHQQGILHRDLKPSNVLIDRADQPRLTDFGLAKRLEEDLELTRTGQVLGTPNFIPPEQAAGNHAEVGPRSDVYSLGAILYFLLTAQPPFLGRSLEETLARVLATDASSPRLVNAKVPRDLETICLKCLEKDPRRRYATARELADELGRFARDEPILARPVGRAGRVWRWCRRHPAVASLAISLTITLVALLAVLALLADRRGAIGAGAGGQAAGPAILTELWVVDGVTLAKTNVGPGRAVSVDVVTGNYWAGMSSPTTYDPAGVIIRDGATDTTLSTIPLSGTNRFCPGAVSVDSIHRRAWVDAQCGHGNDPIWVLNADDYTFTAPIRCGGINGGPCAVNPVSGQFYHTVNDAPQRVDPHGFTQARTSFGKVVGVNASANLLYALSPEGTLQIINGAPDPELILTNVTLPFPAAGFFYMGVDPIRERIYVPQVKSNEIAILDGRTGRSLGRILLVPRLANNQVVQGVAVDSVRNRVYAVTSGKRGRTAYLYVIEDSGQRAIPIPWPAAGPVVNQRFNKVYVWSGTGALD